MPSYEDVMKQLRGVPTAPRRINKSGIFPVIEVAVTCPHCGEPLPVGVQLTSVNFNVLEKKKGNFNPRTK